MVCVRPFDAQHRLRALLDAHGLEKCSRHNRAHRLMDATATAIGSTNHVFYSAGVAGWRATNTDVREDPGAWRMRLWRGLQE